MAEVIEDEAVRAARLLDAQAKAEQLFAEVVRRELETAGSLRDEAASRQDSSTGAP